MAGRIRGVTGIGGYNAICQVCGWKYKASELKLRWDGVWCCEKDWETRHPMDFFRVIPDQHPLPFVLPDLEDVPDSESGYALFDGNTSIRCAVPKFNNEFKTGFPITIEFWINCATGTIGTQRVVINNFGYYQVLILTTGALKFLIWDPVGGTNAWQFTSAFVPTANTWFKYELTSQSTGSGTLTVYNLSNTAVSTESITFGTTVGTAPDNIVSIGNAYTGGSALLGGLDELRIWNIVRTPTELAKRRFQEISGGETSLSLYLNFNCVSRFSWDNKKTGSLYTGTQGFTFNYPHVQFANDTFMSP